MVLLSFLIGLSIYVVYSLLFDSTPLRYHYSVYIFPNLILHCCYIHALFSFAYFVQHKDTSNNNNISTLSFTYFLTDKYDYVYLGFYLLRTFQFKDSTPRFLIVSMTTVGCNVPDRAPDCDFDVTLRLGS